ncbi:MAG: PmoA family protein [Verrucomicrobia subdivision 3 bacterium]|nr:PmoA family protein [Limisphaerales bacterium]
MKPFPIAILMLSVAFSITSQDARGGELRLTETADTIRITLRGKPVLQYIKKAQPVPDGLPKYFRRSGYIHPVYTPTGQELTGDYPADHAHQHALFFAWTKSGYNGRNVDFWNQAKDLGRIEFREVMDLKREEQWVAFSVKHAFKVKTGEKWVDVLHEVWTVTVHQTPADHFLFDIASVQQCVTDKPLSLAKYHYGGMAIRGNYQWLKEKEDHSIKPGDVQYLTSEGKDRWKGNHTRPNWVAFSGKIDGQEVSAAVFCSPKNFRAPQHVRIHPNKPYFCFAPMVEGPFKIAPGKKYVSRYRYLVTSKAVNSKIINEHWRRYAKGGE